MLKAARCPSGSAARQRLACRRSRDGGGWPLAQALLRLEMNAAARLSCGSLQAATALLAYSPLSTSVAAPLPFSPLHRRPTLPPPSAASASRPCLLSHLPRCSLNQNRTAALPPAAAPSTCLPATLPLVPPLPSPKPCLRCPLTAAIAASPCLPLQLPSHYLLFISLPAPYVPLRVAVAALAPYGLPLLGASRRSPPPHLPASILPALLQG